MRAFRLSTAATTLILLALLGTSSNASAATAPTREPIIRFEDVERFYRIYDAAGGHPSAEQLQHDYLDAGSEGLASFARLRRISGARIADTLDKNPAIYADAKRCMAALPRVRERLKLAMHKLAELYPAAKFPPVTIAVGRGKPVGVGSPDSGVMIGLEALCGVRYFDADVEDRFVHVIAHEYIHVQQVRALVDDEHPTVLEGSLIEGAAEFLAETISGGVSDPGVWAEARGREPQIETAFVADEDSTDLSKWLYNGTIEKPGDLGYWVGYRIVKSYYRHSTDKREAVREILQMREPRSFLARSGWRPGVELR